MNSSYFFQHNLKLYTLKQIEDEFNNSGVLEYSKKATDSQQIKIGDTVYVYMTNLRNNTPNRIIFSAEVVDKTNIAFIIRPKKIINNLKLNYNYLSEQNGKDIVFRNITKISDDLLKYIEKEFSNYKPFSIEKLRLYIDDALNYNDIINNQTDILLNNKQIERLNNRKPSLEKNIKNTRYNTNSELGKHVLVSSKYECAIDAKHESFLTKYGNKYMEAHHLIPMKYQKEFKNINLDHLENIVCLCPLCHKKIHHGNLEIQRELIHILYEKYKGKEFFKNIKITETQLLNYYIKELGDTDE